MKEYKFKGKTYNFKNISNKEFKEIEDKIIFHPKNRDASGFGIQLQILNALKKANKKVSKPFYNEEEIKGNYSKPKYNKKGFIQSFYIDENEVMVWSEKYGKYIQICI